MPRHETTPTPEPSAADRLDRYWDAVVRSGSAVPAPTGDEIDPARAALIGRLHASDRGSVPDSARERVWHRARAIADHARSTEENTMDRTRLAPLPSTGAASNGYGPRPLPHPATPVRRLVDPRRWWPQVEFVAAAALVLVFVGGLVALDGGRPGWLDRRSVRETTVPPAADSVNPTVGMQGPGTEYDVAPGDPPTILALRRLTMQPGAALSQDFKGTTLLEVERGTLVITDELSEHAGILNLGPGGSSSASGDGRLTIRNDGETPAVLVQGLVSPSLRSDAAWGLPFAAGIDEVLLGAGEVVGLSVGQMDVAIFPNSFGGPGGGQSGIGRPGADLLVVEAGRLALTRIQGQVDLLRGTADGTAGVRIGEPESVEAGVETALTTGDGALVQPGAAYSLSNPDERTAATLNLTVSPSFSETVPVATPAAIPAADGLGVPFVANPAECRVEPRSLESVRVLVEATPTVGVTPDPGLRAEISSGVPADAETTAGVTATVREVYACFAGGDALRQLALFSDNAIAQAVAGGDFSAEDLVALSRWTGLGGDYEVVVGEVRSFPDGRVGAAIGGSDIAYLTFVRSGDRWLIDAFDDQPQIEGEVSGTPVP